jgi:hypothetical protein
MNIKCIGFTVFVMIFLGGHSHVHAKNEWRTKADLPVNEAGIVESVLIPELYMITKNRHLDLDLVGPDGQSRSFELYWREQVGESNIEILPERFELVTGKGFVWEGSTEKRIDARRIRIDIPDKDFFGKIDVEAFGTKGWVYLKKNETLFRSRGDMRRELDIEKGVYEKIRLYFTSYDKKYQKRFAPIRKVTLIGEKLGKDYVEKMIRPEYQESEKEGMIEVKSVLPGSGLWIQSVIFRTRAQFQGDWKLGTETIEGGRRRFIEGLSGSISHVSGKKQVIKINVGRIWNKKNMILKLDPKGRYIGKISDMAFEVRLLRMVFSADTGGVYTARTGTGKSVTVFKFPGDENRRISHMAVFSEPVKNGDWRPESLVERFGIKGGPFDPEGFAWKSKLPVANPGYFQMVLNLRASHDPNRFGIRLSKGNIQVPYFFGTDEKQAVDLISSSVTSYDSEKNQTTITISFPYASSCWRRVYLGAKGIFKRRVKVEIPKPDQIGWRQWTTRQWENHHDRETKLKINLDSYPGPLKKIRITLYHGDNQPIDIHQIQGVYFAPAVHFLAHENGTYELFGGHPKLPPPDYDLSLVQPYLLEELPKKIQMGPIESVSSAGWKRHASYFFEGKGWGLYAVLGLVTVFLLVIIVKLFPKASQPDGKARKT